MAMSSLSLSLAASPVYSTSTTLISYNKINKPAAQPLPVFQKRAITKQRGCSIRVLFCNPAEDPVVKEALKEPVAFMGGMFAGLLRLDLNEDPLRDWVTRTVEASGLATEESNEDTNKPAPDDEAPLQIEIE